MRLFHSVLAIITLVLPLLACHHVQPRSWAVPEGAKSILVNGYDVTYSERGGGTAVVLVHGTFSDFRYWGQQLEPLGARFRVVSPSLRHHYPERWNGEGDTLTIRQHADDLAELISLLGIGPVHVVGHSRGGEVALRLAANRPDLVRSLVLADPAPVLALIPDSPVAREATASRKDQVMRTLERLNRGEIDSGLEVFIDTNLGAGTWSKMAPSLKQGLRDNAWTMKNLPVDLEEPLGCTDLASFKAPVLLVTGEKSPAIYGEMLKGLRKCLVRFEDRTIPGASHAMARTHAAAFNAAALEFLSRQ